jgi:2-amino-4-hydroxy-6-hydroxymethyldihydropteridine diphosphokinase
MANLEKVYLSVGSNLGDKESNIASSIVILSSDKEILNIRTSSFYETEPLYNKNQSNFLNIMIECETTLTPFKLLDKISEIEKILGRKRKDVKNLPRTIDIDIVIFGDFFIETSQLSIPHPQALFRKFVLVPLKELAPELIFPKTKYTVTELLLNCPDNSSVVKYNIGKIA